MSSRIRPILGFLGMALVASVVTACGGGGSSAGTSAQLPAVSSAPQATTPSGSADVSSTAAPLPAPSGPAVDDWTTYAHDFLRTGFQPQNTGLTKQNVSRLTQRWHYAFPDYIQTSPLVASGHVYLASIITGSVFSLNSTTGTLEWQYEMNGPIYMTPTVADGLLFVGTHDPPSTFAAIDATSGTVRWSKQFPGLIRGTPVVVNGNVYEGESGGDPPACVQGGVFEMNELTGASGWTWNTMPSPGQGGAVWSPISYDGQSFVFGTGNTCTTASTPPGNSMVRISLSGQTDWTYNPVNTLYDDDFGGGMLIEHGQVIGTGKTGYLYSLDQHSGSVVWQTPMGSYSALGGIGTPTTDGRVIVASAGHTAATDSQGYGPGKMMGFNNRGAILWSLGSTMKSYSGYAAINNGIAFFPIDKKLVAVDMLSGQILWSFQTPDVISGSPVVVPSGVYVADHSGNVYAFSLPSSATTSQARYLKTAR